jgi:hypothetical protein
VAWSAQQRFGLSRERHRSPQHAREYRCAAGGKGTKGPPRQSQA